MRQRLEILIMTSVDMDKFGPNMAHPTMDHLEQELKKHITDDLDEVMGGQDNLEEIMFEYGEPV